MKRAIADILCCPACRTGYELNASEFHPDTIETGFLTCPNCLISIPVLNGFPLFEEQFLAPADGSKISPRLFGTPEEYLTFLDRKRSKPAYDLYAAFQPFNESTQCIFPLLPLLHETVKPGDRILDLWCRTGWTGEFLASEFPQQHVLSVWENSAGLLGYRGFHFWLGSEKRLGNLDIIFHSPNLPLPFRDGAFAVVHGLDTLHRYRHLPLIPECLRVVKKEGLIAFPHVHLTNSEPVPFFERGETQHHGKEYDDYFARLLRGTEMKAFILSEKKLFDARKSFTLQSEPETDHFNATVLLAAKRNDGRSFGRREKTASGFKDAYVVFNPLCKIDFVLREATMAPEALGGGAQELFYRHPIYRSRLEEHLPAILDEQDCLILYWAERFKTVSEIAVILDKEYSEIFQRILALEAKEIVQLQNVSEAMAKLHQYYCRQEYRKAATLSQLWSRAVSLHGEKPYLHWSEDGSVFSYKDADVIVRMALSFLKSLNLQKGDRVLIETKFHPEFFFLFWAVVLNGCVAVPFNPEMKKQTYEAIVAATQPAAIFSNLETERENTRMFAFGLGEESPRFQGSFSERIGDYDPAGAFVSTSESEPAVVLFTSGSTGMPKGVVISHGALFRSAEIVHQAYRWKDEDCYLGAGSFHTMSGLRNPCIAVLHSGALVLIPSKDDVENPMKIFDLCLQYGVSILNATPSLLAFWKKASTKAKFFEDHRLRMFLSTGLSLHPTHRDLFENLFHTPVYDYYGLTETTGACILQDTQLKNTEDTGIGRPWGCLIKIVNDRDETLRTGETGELAIYSENLLLGYLGNPSLTKSRIRNGWFYTGDLGCIQPSGCVKLLGRKDRMMIDKNGENVYPEEIEQAIASIPGIAEAFVTQYQDDQMIHRIAALVSFQKTDAANVTLLKAALAGILPDPHVPFLILQVPELPKNSAGKVSIEGVLQMIRGSL